MTITTITVSDPSTPTEVQTWFNDNPTAVVVSIWNDGRTFYIITSA